MNSTKSCECVWYTTHYIQKKHFYAQATFILVIELTMTQCSRNGVLRTKGNSILHPAFMNLIAKGSSVVGLGRILKSSDAFIFKK